MWNFKPYPFTFLLWYDMITLLEHSFILNYEHSMVLYNSHAYTSNLFVKHSEAVHCTVNVTVYGTYPYRWAGIYPYADLNRWVFNSFLNLCISLMSFSSHGKLFHSLLAWTKRLCHHRLPCWSLEYPTCVLNCWTLVIFWWALFLSNCWLCLVQSHVHKGVGWLDIWILTFL